MKKPMSLRLRLTLLCAALLTLCCLLLTLTNNLSAVQMADAMQAVPVLPAQDAAGGAAASLPMMELEASETVRQARGIFHLQSLLAMAAVLAAGLFLKGFAHDVHAEQKQGKAAKQGKDRSEEHTSELQSPTTLSYAGAQRRIWAGPWPSRTAGTRWLSWPARSTRCPGG